MFLVACKNFTRKRGRQKRSRLKVIFSPFFLIIFIVLSSPDLLQFCICVQFYCCVAIKCNNLRGMNRMKVTPISDYCQLPLSLDTDDNDPILLPLHLHCSALVTLTLSLLFQQLYKRHFNLSTSTVPLQCKTCKWILR